MRFACTDKFIRGRLIPPIAQTLWLISVVCCVFMLINIISVLMHLSERKSTNGEIIAYVELPGTERFHPKIRFTDMQGTVHEFVDAIGATAPLYLVGTIVQVDYNPEQPNIAEMTTLYFRWGSSIGLFFIVTIFWILGSRFTYKV
jgi:hypothetical protein